MSVSLIIPGMKKQPKIIHAFIILLFLFKIQSLLYSQPSKIDAVYLENGSIIRGKILEDSDTSIIRIETLCHNVWVFNKHEISKIERQKPGYSINGKPKGYYNLTDIGLIIGSGNNDKNIIFGIHMINGYKWENHICTGAGLGIEFFEYMIIPTFADLRYQWLNRTISPYVLFNAGYAFPLQDPESYWGTINDAKGGMLWSTGIGTNFRINEHNAVSLGLIYRYQKLRTIYTTEWNDEETEILKKYERLSIRIGLVFE